MEPSITPEDIIDAFAEAQYEADQTDLDVYDDSPQHNTEIVLWGAGFGEIDGVVNFYAVAEYLSKILAMKASHASGLPVQRPIRVANNNDPDPGVFGLARAAKRITSGEAE